MFVCKMRSNSHRYACRCASCHAHARPHSAEQHSIGFRLECKLAQRFCNAIQSNAKSSAICNDANSMRRILQPTDSKCQLANNRAKLSMELYNPMENQYNLQSFSRFWRKLHLSSANLRICAQKAIKLN